MSKKGMFIAIIALTCTFVAQPGCCQNKNGATQNGATQNGAAKNGATKNGATQNGAAKNGAIQNGAAPKPEMAGTIQWMTNYQNAAAQAKKESKYLFLFFTGSDWCGWCKKMESETFADPEFAKTVGNRFVFVELDFPMGTSLPADLATQNNDLKKKYGITGYPTVVILDASGNFVAETGYRPGGGKAYADYLLQLIK